MNYCLFLLLEMDNFNDFSLLKDKTLEEIACFIFHLNLNPKTNIGYVPFSYDEIKTSIKNNMNVKDDIIVLGNDEKIIGVLALDRDLESAEVWGPFVEEGYNYFEVSKVLIDIALTIGNIKLQFFINEENHNAINFLNCIKAKYINTHYNMEIAAHNLKLSQHIVSFTKEYEVSFIALHNLAFKDSYYNGLDIINMLDFNHHLLIYPYILHSNLIMGYLFYTIFDKEKEINIEFIASAQSFQKRGVATSLINHCIKEAFDKGIKNIKITVSSNNEKAISFYKNRGFIKTNTYKHYTYSVR